MADSAQGATKLPAYEQVIDNTARDETTIEERGAYGDVARAVHNVDAHVHRDAAPTRGPAAYPSMATSEVAPGAHDANNSDHITENTEPSPRTQPASPAPDHHIPPQAPQLSVERRLRQEHLEELTQYLPANSPRVERWDKNLQRYRHHDELPPIPPRQTADAARATVLPPILPRITPLLDLYDAQAQHRVLPAGHRREIPANWVAERDLSYGHRMARLHALEFEYTLHELDHRIRANQHKLRRYLYECRRNI